jgi:probable phosphoglycerate mutase
MVAEHHPMAMRMWAEETFEVIPGAERSADFAARVRDAVGRLAAAHTGQRVAVFTHGGVIGEALAQASGSRPFAFVTSDNGSISRLVVSGERWIVRGFNDTAHLDPPPPD